MLYIKLGPPWHHLAAPLEVPAPRLKTTVGVLFVQYTLLEIKVRSCHCDGILFKRSYVLFKYIPVPPRYKCVPLRYQYALLRYKVYFWKRYRSSSDHFCTFLYHWFLRVHILIWISVYIPLTICCCDALLCVCK